MAESEQCIVGGYCSAHKTDRRHTSDGRLICPRCNEPIRYLLSNSLVCDICYRAAIMGVSRERILRDDEAYLVAVLAEQRKRDRKVAHE